MGQENFELNLLASVSKVLIENSNPLEILFSLGRIFNKYGRTSGKFVELKGLNIYIYDDSTKTLRDFSKNWFVIQQTNTDSYNDKLYQMMTQFGEFSFFVNGKPYKMEEVSNFLSIKTSNENNILAFPLKKNNRPFGLLELNFPGSITNLLGADFFMILSIISYQISLKIQNTTLNEQMQKNIDFYKSMKNIAKIIETQYDLNYIIPIIGEMIDRFVSMHLVYIFLRSDESSQFRLVWPSACRDKNILDIISELKNESKFVLKNDGKIGVFPITSKNVLLGCIVAHSTTDRLSDKEIDYIDQLSKQSSITIQRANAYAEVLQHATLDALTGLNNRRQFETRLKQEVANAQRQKKPLCAMMMDVDFFKKVNDTYGHVAGDTVLKAVSAVIKTTVRENDIPSRYGGEEFTVLLPYTKSDEAFIVAQRIRNAVERSVIDVFDDQGELTNQIKVTISIGVNEFKVEDSAQELYQKADKALYIAKTTGRNKVVIYQDSFADTPTDK